MGDHARLSPSNHRWPHCPGSVAVEAQYPDIPGAAAVDGTGSHLLLETCLTSGKFPSDFVGTIIGVNHEDNPNGWMVDRERAERVQEALSYLVRRQMELSQQFPGCSIAVESESQADPGGMFGRDDWYGTCDITLSVFQGSRCLFLEVIDYKDGRGWVDVNNNTQLLSYLGGKLREHVASGPDLVRPFNPGAVSSVRMTVVQPKTNPSVRYQDLDTEVALKLLDDLSWRAHQTDRPDAPLVPGKHCTWCKHKPNCSEQSKQDVEKVKTMTNNLTVTGDQSLFEVIESTFGDVTSLSNDSLAELLDAEDGIHAVFDRVRAEAQRRLETGDTVPGYALKPGNGRNVWAADEEQVVKALKARKWKQSDIYPPKLISPAQVMKSDLLTKDQKARFEREYIAYVAGDLKLTKVERKAPTFEEQVALFADIKSDKGGDAPELELSFY